MSAPGDETTSDVLRILAVRAGLAPESFTAAAITYAVRNRMAAGGAASQQDYIRRLAADAAEFQELLEELVVPETWFFRDPRAFRCFTRQACDWCACNGGIFRVLCAGCSTGEEVYSLAIALRDAGCEPGQFSILGTDVSRRSLHRARNAEYGSRSFRERDEALAALRQRWCTRVGDVWQVRDETRESVEFLPGNLSLPGYLSGEPPFHAVFCRNVLIYFHSDARKVAVQRLHSLLHQDGLLYSAPAEARIFSEAGFASLGSECPFAFRPSKDRPSEHRPTMPLPVGPQSPSVFSHPAPATSHFSSLIPHPSAQPAQTRASNSTWQKPHGPSALQAAVQAADEGRLDEADALCGQALSDDPRSAEAHYLRGIVRQAQGALDEAQRSLEKALYLDPKHYQALVHMMLLAEDRGNPRAAENYRRRAEQVASEGPKCSQ